MIKTWLIILLFLFLIFVPVISLLVCSFISDMWRISLYCHNTLIFSLGSQKNWLLLKFILYFVTFCLVHFLIDSLNNRYIVVNLTSVLYYFFEIKRLKKNVFFCTGNYYDEQFMFLLFYILVVQVGVLIN